MSELQRHVRNLVNFFVKAEAMVRSAVDTHLKTFTKQAEASVGKVLQDFVKRVRYFSIVCLAMALLLKPATGTLRVRLGKLHFI